MLAIEVEFLRGIFEAGGNVDEACPEWPPHPARLFNGLVAAAESEDERSALRWLEQQGAPEIVASEEIVEAGGRASYVPTNRIEKAPDSYGRMPVRKALGPRTWRAVSPSSPCVRFEWPGSPSAGVRNALGDLATRLPYLGRSTSPVVALAADDTDGDTGAADGRVRWIAVTDATIGTPLELPAPGYLDALTDAFESGRSAWEVPRSIVDYRAARSDLPDMKNRITSPYGEMIVLGFGGRRFGAGHALGIASRLREAIESHVDGGPVVLRGLPPLHRRTPAEQAMAVPQHQVIITCLPFVGAEHADGQLRGVAVMLPTGIDTDDRAVILRGLRGVLQGGLNLGKLGKVELEATASSLDTLRSQRWTQPSTHWVSATPISANRYHGAIDGDVMEREVRISCGHMALPDPSAVRVSKGPLISGAEVLAAPSRMRHPKEKVTASFHASITFDEPVGGPVLLGSLRRYGLGLMLPVPHALATSGQVSAESVSSGSVPSESLSEGRS